MDKIYLTNEVATVLDLSIATVRNYAKYLERAGHEFNMKKQARLWTDVEIELIREIQKFYNNNDYPLEMCFDYVVKKRQDGEQEANKILEVPVTTYNQHEAISPQTEYLEGIQSDTKALISMLDDMRTQLPDKRLIEQQTDYKNEVDHVKSENEKLLDELKELNEEKEQLENQIQALKNMNTLEFWKFKKD